MSSLSRAFTVLGSRSFAEFEFQTNLAVSAVQGIKVSRRGTDSDGVRSVALNCQQQRRFQRKANVTKRAELGPSTDSPA